MAIQRPHPTEEGPNPPTMKGQTYDAIFQHINTFGKYQIFLWALSKSLLLPITAQFIALNFVTGTPQFHCVTANVTCEPSKCCRNCTEYVFDGPMHTTVSEWNLICDRAYLGATVQSCFFAGMLVGSFVSGIISDAWGRKKCLFAFFSVMLVAGTASSFVKWISLYAFLRFVVGFGLTGAMLSIYVYMMEMVGTKKRTLIAAMNEIFYTIGDFTYLGVAYACRDWRTLNLYYTVPAAALFFFWKWIPESPRWLVAHGRLDEAYDVMIKCGPKRGKKSIDSTALKTLITHIREDQIEREKHARKYTPIDLVRTPKLRRWSSILAYLWFTTGFVGFGMFMFISQLAGDIYVNYLIFFSLRVFKMFLVLVIQHKFGRRIFHSLTSIIFAAMLLTVLAIYRDHPSISTPLAIVGGLFGSMQWSTVYLFATELFPTLMRNIALGTGSTCARVGAILSPYAIMTAQLPGLTLAAPIGAFSAVALLSGILAFVLPETVFAKMHQTVEEAEQATDDYTFPCCKRQREEVRYDEKSSGMSLEMGRYRAVTL